MLIWDGLRRRDGALPRHLSRLASRGRGQSIDLRPFPEPVWDFTYLSVFRTLIPASIGGPWRWQPVGYGGAFVDSPRLFDWLALVLAAAFVVRLLGVAPAHDAALGRAR